MTGVRTVVLAVNPDVMPEVQKILAGTLFLGEPVAGEEGLRVHPVGAQRLPPLRVTPPECTPEEVARRMGLWRRLFEVLQLLSLGLSRRQIARRLEIAELTVKAHSKRGCTGCSMWTVVRRRRWRSGTGADC